MIKLSKKAVFTAACFMSASMFVTIPCLTVQAAELSAIVVESSGAESSSQQITLYSATIEWRYKVENGKLYRRQYNYATQQWMGDWQLCP